MSSNIHPVHYYSQNIIRKYHDKLSTVFGTRLTSDAAKVPEAEPYVGIVGGGVGGLFAAMLLQHCGIRYQILERSEEVGGRLHTHYFSDQKNDYYDVGAMRFPNNPITVDVFRLFDKISIADKIIPYHFSVDESNILYFNGVRKVKSDSTAHLATAFDIHEVPEPWASIGPGRLVEYVVKPFIDALVEDADQKKESGWNLLMRYDAYSARTYMEKFDLIVQTGEDKTLLNADGLLPYPPAVVHWMELFGTSTNSYNTAFSEMVLDELAFSWPGSQDWYCVQGGSSQITKAMVAWLTRRNKDPVPHIVTNAPVTAISRSGDNMEVKYGAGNRATYTHVITTTALPCFKAVDLSKAQLTVPQKTAIRCLAYGPSTKIGVKFRSAWWTNPAVMKQYGDRGPITAGQSLTDCMSRTIVYPSYGDAEDDRSHVLLASYAWTSDAQAFGSLMAQPSDAAEVKRVVLRDLVNVHGFNEAGAAFLEREWVDAYAHNWAMDPRTMGGAFAQFNAGQFRQLYPALTMPAAGQKLWFAGEVISSEHAWVSGALGASARAVKGLIISAYGLESPQLRMYNTFWADSAGTAPSSHKSRRLPAVPARWEPEGWTTDMFMKQLVASQLPSEVLINHDAVAKA